MKRVPTITVEAMRDIEAELSEPLFRGMPLGPALAHALHEHGRYPTRTSGLKTALTNVLLCRKYRMRPMRWRGAKSFFPTGRILVTWTTDNFRNAEMVGPIIDELGPARCFVIALNDRVLASLPAGIEGATWPQLLDYDAREWSRDFRDAWGALKKRLRASCSRHRMPLAVHTHLAFMLILSSQYVMGCEAFLGSCRPAALLTDHDRQSPWSSLVLAARKLKVPSYTLVHGVVNDKAIGYAPLLADKMLCWGEIDRRKLMAAGVDPARLSAVGCPRLSRQLSADRVASRSKVGLLSEQPVVLLATCPFASWACLKFADDFCQALEKIPAAKGIIRLHPSESLESYAALIQRHPAVRFMDNSAWTLDESIAASDVVVVHSSGFGSDALMRGRLVVVYDAIDVPLGHGEELVKYGGCPHTRTVDELAATLQLFVSDDATKKRASDAAREFSELVSVAYGKESARRIADQLRSHLPLVSSDRTVS